MSETKRERAEYGRDRVSDLSAARAELAALRAVVADYPDPRCDIHPNDDPIACGWKRAFTAMCQILTDGSVADAPAAEPERPKPCSNCGMSYEACTERIRKGRRACCGTCGYSVTHDQNPWEAWDRGRRVSTPAADDEGCPPGCPETIPHWHHHGYAMPTAADVEGGRA